MIECFNCGKQIKSELAWEVIDYHSQPHKVCDECFERAETAADRARKPWRGWL